MSFCGTLALLTLVLLPNFMVQVSMRENTPAAKKGRKGITLDDGSSKGAPEILGAAEVQCSSLAYSIVRLMTTIKVLGKCMLKHCRVSWQTQP